MAESYTPNYDLILPEVGGSSDTWGEKLNENFSTIDGVLSPEEDGDLLHRESNLSDLNNASTARDNLGLGDAATRDVGESSGNLMEVGAFGLGSTQPGVIGDAFDPQVGGFYRDAGSTLNTPPGFGRTNYVVSPGFDQSWTLLAIERNTGRAATLGINVGGVPTEWRELAAVNASNTFSRGNRFSLGTGELSLDQSDWSADVNVATGPYYTEYISRTGDASEGWRWRSHSGDAGGTGGVTAATLDTDGNLSTAGTVEAGSGVFVGTASGASAIGYGLYQFDGEIRFAIDGTRSIDIGPDGLYARGLTDVFNLNVRGVIEGPARVTFSGATTSGVTGTGIYRNTAGAGSENVSIAVDGTTRLRMDDVGNIDANGDLSVSGGLETGGGVSIGGGASAASIGSGIYLHNSSGELRVALDGSRALDISSGGLHVRGDLTMSGGMSASNITSGTLNSNRIPSAHRMTTSNVLSAISGVRRGDVGYTGYMRNDLADISLHSTRAGSGLSFAYWTGSGSLTNYSTTPQGTWRILGSVAGGTSNRNQAHQWVRIS